MTRSSFALLLALSAASSPVLAQTALERIEPRLSRAIEEHTVFLTCSSLEPGSFELIRSNWEDMVASARGYLSTHFTPIADLESFDRRTEVDALVDWKKPLGEVAEFCSRNGDWYVKLSRFQFVHRIDDTPLPDE